MLSEAVVERTPYRAAPQRHAGGTKRSYSRGFTIEVPEPEGSTLDQKSAALDVAQYFSGRLFAPITLQHREWSAAQDSTNFWTTAATGAEDYVCAQRQEKLRELGRAIAEIKRIEFDDQTPFDASVIASAIVVLDAIEQSPAPVPKVTWQGRDTIVFTWRRGPRVDALVVTETEALLLRDGVFDLAIPPVATGATAELSVLLTLVLS